MAKLGFTRVYIIFFISAQNIDCDTRKNRLAEAVLTSTHNLCFEQKCEQYRVFLSEKFQFLEVKFSIHLNRRVFIMRIKNEGMLGSTLLTLVLLNILRGHAHIIFS